jgi:hypothetical protein
LLGSDEERQIEGQRAGTFHGDEHNEEPHGRDEDCSGSCGSRAGILNRKITQVLMEVLIEKEWIWWNEAAGKAATPSGRMASV